MNQNGRNQRNGREVEKPFSQLTLEERQQAQRVRVRSPRTMQSHAPSPALRDALRFALQSCSGLEREILAQRYEIDLTPKEVAFIQNRPPVAIQMMEISALAKMQLALTGTLH